MIGNIKIGPQLLSIITQQLYPDILDALREYVQNAVDANASQAAIYYSDKDIIIEDDGDGMTEKELENAVNIGVSNKDPKLDVGYKGIGIYSGLSITESILITSVKAGETYILGMNCASIRKRISARTSSDELIQVLRNNISIRKGESSDFINFNDRETKTQVKLVSVINAAQKVCNRPFNDPDSIDSFLQRSLPVHFSQKFIYAQKIDIRIKKDAATLKQPYKQITISLQKPNEEKNYITKPYQYQEKGVHEPIFLKIKKGEHTFGIAWGCLNQKRKVFSDPNHRGFLFKKHGFSIGDALYMQKFFVGGKKFSNRYIGEFIILHEDILPDASRSRIQLSDTSTMFEEAVRDVCKQFEEIANDYQELNIAEEECNNLGQEYGDTEKIPDDEYTERLQQIAPAWSRAEAYEEKTTHPAYFLYHSLYESLKKLLPPNLINNIKSAPSQTSKTPKRKYTEVHTALREFKKQFEPSSKEGMEANKLFCMYQPIKKLNTKNDATCRAVVSWTFLEVLSRVSIEYDGLVEEFDNSKKTNKSSDGYYRNHIHQYLDKYISYKGDDPNKDRRKEPYKSISRGVAQLNQKANDIKHSPQMMATLSDSVHLLQKAEPFISWWIQNIQAKIPTE